MNIRTLLSLCCAITFSAPVSHALEFRLLSWAGTIEDLKYAPDSKPVDIIAWDSVLSPRYQFTGPGPIILFREIEVEGKKVREPVTRVQPPAGLTHAILLLAPDDSTRTTYTARLIDNSPETRKPQTITYLNLSRYPVAIKLGDEELTVAAQETITRPTDPAFERLALKIAAQTEAGWEIIASSSQPIRPGLRTLVILRDGRLRSDGATERIDFLSFNDLPPLPNLPGTSVSSVAGVR